MIDAAMVLQVQPDSAGDVGELAEITGRLRAELLELDVAAVVPVDQDTAPEHAKGLATLAGALVVRWGTLDVLRGVVQAVRNWATRTNRTVEVSLGGDVLKLTGVSSDQQDKVIDAWLSRHATGT